MVEGMVAKFEIKATSPDVLSATCKDALVNYLAKGELYCQPEGSTGICCGGAHMQTRTMSALTSANDNKIEFTSIQRASERMDVSILESMAIFAAGLSEPWSEMMLVGTTMGTCWILPSDSICLGDDTKTMWSTRFNTHPSGRYRLFRT